MRSFLKALYVKFVSGKQKAIVALVMPIVISGAAHLWHLDANHLTQVVAASGVFTGAGVFFKANK